MVLHKVWHKVLHVVSLTALAGIPALMDIAHGVQAQGGNTVYLPLVMKGGCSVNQTFGQWPRGAGYPVADRPAEQHPDLNLAVRGYSQITGQTLGLINVGGATDPGAPQLDGILNRGVPTFIRTYRVHQAPWEPNPGAPIPNPSVTLLGFQVTPSELVRVPSSGYDIGGGFEVRVLYAAASRITFVYTTRDDVVEGYTIQIENVCVDPALVSLYNQLNAAGRNNMPALIAGQPFGTTSGTELLVAIRDQGAYLDPRVRKDWWKGY